MKEFFGKLLAENICGNLAGIYTPRAYLIGRRLLFIRHHGKPH